MCAQVITARKAQSARLEGTKARYNAQMGPRLLRQFCKLDEESQNLLRSSVNEMGLSARAHDKILRVARTIADLEGAPSIELPHVSEAINYRMLDRRMGK
jgi:magnesium chelatase family protein